MIVETHTTRQNDYGNAPKTKLDGQSSTARHSTAAQARRGRQRLTFSVVRRLVPFADVFPFHSISPPPATNDIQHHGIDRHQRGLGSVRSVGRKQEGREISYQGNGAVLRVREARRNQFICS